MDPLRASDAFDWVKLHDCSGGHHGQAPHRAPFASEPAIGASGVPTPDPSGTIERPEHYDNWIAKNYADEGYLKFASILEAGHACAACHLTHFINRIPHDDEIDLERYATVAVLMRGAAVVSEILSTGYMGAVESMELRLGSQSFRISALNATGPLDSVTLRQVGEEILSNPVASRSLVQVQRQGTEVVFDFGEPPFGEMGRAVRPRNVIKVHVQAHRSAKEVTSTFVHEASHIHHYFRGARATQLDEVRAFSREFLYQNGRRPSLDERAAIWEQVGRDYSHLPED
jgi:hypothetical protein